MIFGLYQHLPVETGLKERFMLLRVPEGDGRSKIGDEGREVTPFVRVRCGACFCGMPKSSSSTGNA